MRLPQEASADMRHPSTHGGTVRFQSPDYHAALATLKAAHSTTTTVLTLAGGTPPELHAGAELVAKSLGLRLFRVNLSQVVSKYIGETEKNLEMVFARAESKNWVLYFDEGDALFGRGDQSSGSQSPSAEAGTGILVKLERYRGFVIAALKQPPPPAQPHRKIRHLHVRLPRA